MTEPVEIRLVLNKEAVAADLARMKEKVRQGQAPVSPGQLPGIAKPDTGRAGEVDRALEQDRDRRLSQGLTSFLQDAASGGIASAGLRALLRSAEQGEMGTFAAGASRFVGKTTQKVGEGIAIFQILDAITGNLAVIVPVLYRAILDKIGEEFPWFPKTLGKDTAEMAQEILESIKEQFDRIKTTAAATSESLDLQKARLRLGADTNFVGDLALLQRIKENEARVDRAERRDLLRRFGDNLEKKLMGGAH